MVNEMSVSRKRQNVTPELNKYQARFSKDAAGLHRYIAASLNRRNPFKVKMNNEFTADRLGISLDDLHIFQDQLNADGLLSCRRGERQSTHRFVQGQTVA
jgi:hypothetical protein